MHCICDKGSKYIFITCVICCIIIQSTDTARHCQHKPQWQIYRVIHDWGPKVFVLCLGSSTSRELGDVYFIPLKFEHFIIVSQEITKELEEFFQIVGNFDN